MEKSSRLNFSRFTLFLPGLSRFLSVSLKYFSLVAMATGCTRGVACTSMFAMLNKLTLGKFKIKIVVVKTKQKHIKEFKQSKNINPISDWYENRKTIKVDVTRHSKAISKDQVVGR